MLRSILLLISLMIFVGCSPKPSESTARKLFDADVKEISGGRGMVTQFAKKDAIERVASGTQVYVLEFEAQIRVEQDCRVNAKGGILLDMNPRPYRFLSLPTEEDVKKIKDSTSGLTYGAWRKGDIMQIKGEMLFEKKESGWVPESLTVYKLSPADAPGGQVTIRGAGIKW
jgi:hypothetical protein